jgi:uncharacterized protein YbjQ (UPF0145 family)
MLLSTTSHIEGHQITQYHGIVMGEAILGANIFKDLFAGFRDIVGGRAQAYEEELKKARDFAMQEMVNDAQAVGANAVIGIALDYAALGAQNGMLMVTATGTAVTYA